MSFLAKLTLDNKNYNILEFSYNPLQATDIIGKPIGVPRGGCFTLKLEATKDSTFLQWVLSTAMAKEGVITFYKRDSMSIQSQIKFETGYCVDRTQEFTNSGKAPMTETIKIAPGKVYFDDYEYEEVWNIKKADMSKATTFVEEEEEVIKYVNGHFYNNDGTFEGKVNEAINTGNVTDVYTCTGKGKATDSKGVEIDVYDGIKKITENGKNLTHDVFAKSSNIVCHESSGNKIESLWIAHTANNAHSDNNIDYKKQNNSVHDQLMDKQYSTTDHSARTPLSTTDNSEKAKNARAALLNVITGGLDPTGGAVLFDGVDFLKKGLSHNKFNEFITVSINSTILNKFTQNAEEIGARVNPNYTKDSIFSVRRPGDDFKEAGTGKYFSLEATGTNGGSIFWKTIKK